MRRKFLSVVLCVCMMLTMAPFAFAAETEVAQVGSQKYTSLEAAVNAVGDDGATVTLLNNVMLDSTLVLNKSLTLDLNGHKISNGSSLGTSYLIQINHSSKVTLVGNARNSLIQDTRNNDMGTITAICVYGELTISGSYLTISRGANGIAVKVDEQSPNQGKLTVNSGTISVDTATVTSSQAIQNWGTTIINGGTFKGDVDSYSYGSVAGTITINGGTFNGDVYAAQMKYHDSWPTASAQVTINGGNFSKTIAECYHDSTSGYQPIQQVDRPEGVTESEVSISGGIFTNDDTNSIANTIAISGGVFKAQVSASTQKGELYVYPSTNPVAEIGGFKFSNLADAAYAAADGDTITLLANTTLYEKLQLNRKVVLDLGNYTITRASTGEQRAIWVNSGADVTINSGSNGCVTAPVIALQVNNGGKLTVNGGAYHGAYALTSFSSADETAETIINNGVFDGWIYTNGTGHKDYITFNGGTYNEMMYLASGDHSTYTITNGTFKKGLEIDAGRLGISGGTFTANEDTSGNVNHPITNNNGSGAYVGTIVVCKPSGSSTTGYIGDAVVNITGGTFENAFANSETIVVADYGQSQNQAGKAKVTISGDAKVTGKVVLYKATGNTGEQLDISGGYFTSDPTAYVASGYAAVETTKPGYNYEVITAEPTKAEVSTADPDVQLPDNLKSDVAAQALQSSLKEATDLVDGDGLTAAAKTIANRNTITKDAATNALKNAGLTPMEGTNVRIVVQTYMDINITAVDTTSPGKKTLSLDITPMYRTVATTATENQTIIVKDKDSSEQAANAVLIPNASGNLTINKPVTIKIPLPTDFISPATTGANDYPSIYVQHKGYEYTASVSNQSGTLYATFTNPHGFSSFTITAAPTAVAEVNGTSYINFQDAVDAVENGGAIKALKDINSTVSGNKTFTVNANSNTVTLTAASGYTLTKDAAGKYTVSHQSSGGPGSSGGSISTPTTYAVNVNAATNGAVAADKKTASKGTTVTVTASPSKGYVVDAVKVVDKDGKDVAVTEKDGKYVFTMPASAVTVTGSFKAETPAPVALPFTDVKSGNWFYDAVKYAYAQGLMTGTSATTFAPNGTMNRAMIVTVLYRLEKSPAVTGASKFTDVPAGQWYSDAVAWAAANKIVNGYDETTFGPMNAVTREQMAAILFRYEQVKGLENVTLEENLNRFPDQNKISAYAIPALQWAVGQKIINGNADGTLDPTGTATRAQVAQISTNLLNK